MNTEQQLRARSESKCELCNVTDGLDVHQVSPRPSDSADKCVLLCATCREQISDAKKMDAQRWRCLSESMWSEQPAVQVMAWRMLKRLESEAWAHDLIETLYLDEETLAWAQEGADESDEEEAVQHVDSNGTILANGDTVTLVKALVVKGGGFTAKRGTAVRNIRVVAGNAEHIEGRVEGQQIVILTQFVKKS